MRPALLRLLKRPSAVSVLDSLISTPIGIEQLESRYKYLRCHPRRIWKKTNAKEIEFEPESPSPPTASRPFSFRVHEIEPSREEADDDVEHPLKDSDIGVSAQGPSQSLGLQPEKLEFESDIGHTKDIDDKLVDDPARRQDFALWEELLRYRQRHYGDKGTLDIWEGLTFRVDGIQLPVDRPRADFFWGSFVDLGLRRENFMKELEGYASELWKNTGKRWNGFYQTVVAGFFERGMVQQAVAWHARLQHTHLNHPDDILQLLQPAISIAPQQTVNESTVLTNGRQQLISSGVRAFKKICNSTEGHRIYAPVISKLLQAGLGEEALSMHTFLVARHDYPQRFEDIKQLLEYAMYYAPRPIFQKLQTYANDRFASQQQMEFDDQNAATTKGQDPKPDNREWLGEKPFKDDFGARLFATRALNFDMILAGLQMFGVMAIGPQSLREMAVRAHSSQDILDKLRLLESSNISVGGSVFARLLRKLATANRDIVLSDLLHNDQHPDVLENAPMQESLLVSYYMARDWRQYQMTLAILGEVSEDDVGLFNVHFRKYIAAGEFASAVKVVDAMTLRGQALTNDSIKFMVQKALSPRRPGLGPPIGPGLDPKKEAIFVFGILQRVAHLGCSVDVELWVEILKRLGMLNRWKELRGCCLWLARHYSPQAKRNDDVPWTIPSDQQGAGSMALPVNHGSRMLAAIFNRQMQTAMVAWGFRMRLSSNLESKAYNPFGVEGERLVPWVRGLVLLRELERNGVSLAVGWIRRTCRHRLAVLFGRTRSSSRHMNRMLRRENPYKVHRVLHDMDRAWGDLSLFGDPGKRDLYRLVNPPSTKMSLRRTRRTVWRATQLRGRAFAQTK